LRRRGDPRDNRDRVDDAIARKFRAHVFSKT
jgi:hypothetical protein